MWARFADFVFPMLFWCEFREMEAKVICQQRIYKELQYVVHKLSWLLDKSLRPTAVEETNKNDLLQ